MKRWRLEAKVEVFPIRLRFMVENGDEIRLEREKLKMKKD